MAAKRIEVVIGEEAFEELGVNIGTDIVSASAELCWQNVGKQPTKKFTHFKLPVLRRVTIYKSIAYP